MVDQDTNNYASLTNVVSIAGSAFLAVKDESQSYPAGTYAGFDIENANFATANIFNNIVITTYLNGTKQEEKLGSGLQLISGGVIDYQNRTTVGFETTKPFDEVQITTRQPIGVTLGTTKVFSAVIKKFCEGPDLACNTNTVLTETQYPVSISSERTGVYGVFSAQSVVTEPDNLLDSNPNNYASITLPATIGTGANISVKKSLSKYPVGTFAGFEFQNTNFLSADVLKFITINTYRDGVLQESVTGNGLVFGLGTDLLASSGRYTMGIIAKKEFDEIQFTVINVVGINLGTTKIFKVVAMKPCPKIISCNSSYYWNQPDFPVVLNAKRTGLVSLVSAGSSVNNPDNVIDNDPNTYSRITVAAGVANAGQISVVDPTATYPQGTFAGFTVKDRYFVVQGDLLEFITVKTYLNGTLQESKTSTDLVDITLLIPIWGTGTKNVGFVTTKPFNEIQIVVSSVASVANITDVFGAFIDTRTSNGGSLNCAKAIDAVNDNISVNAGATSSASVITNDTYEGAPAVIGTAANQVKITQTSTTNAGVNIDPATGKVVVNPGTAPGTYTINYTLCNNITPPSCDNAQVTVVVANTPISAVADNYTGFTSGTAGTTPSVLVNDTLDGQPVTVGTNGNVTLEPGTLPAGFTMNADGTVQVPASAPAGTYEIPYTICENANITNCSTVTSTVVVAPKAIVPPVAVDDAITINNYAPGGLSTVSVLNNDSYNNGVPGSADGYVTINNITPSNPKVTIDPVTGLINVAPNTAPGTYTVTYNICDKNNPSNCSNTATATIVLKSPDMTVKTSLSAPTVSVGVPIDSFYEVTNIGTINTSGDILVNIYKEIQPGTFVEKQIPAGWQKSAEDEIYITYRYTGTMAPGQSVMFVYTYTKSINVVGVIPFRGFVQPGSGGETVFNNNNSQVIATMVQ